MKILLIGGNGYIGSSLYTKLKDLSLELKAKELRKIKAMLPSLLL